MIIWTAPSTRKCFKNAFPKEGDSNSFTLRAARGEIVSMQCLLHNDFRTGKKGGEKTVKISGYEVVLSEGADYDVSKIRIQAQQYISFADEIAYPDPISNTCVAEIEPMTSQAMWVTFPIDENQPAGEYVFRIVFKSDKEYEAFVTLKVYNVSIPPSNEGTYSIEHFQTPEDEILLRHAGYVCNPFDEEWWCFMKNYAKSLKECRSNIYRIYPLELLKAAGSKRVKTDKWNFDFSYFDKMVKLLKETGTAKGFAINDSLASWAGDVIYSLNEAGEIISLDISKPEAEIWARQYFTALYEHIITFDTIDNWILHIQDEPHNTKGWLWAYKIAKECMGDIRCGNPMDSHIGTKLGDYNDIYIPYFPLAEEKVEFYDKQLKKPKKEVWPYCCCEPNRYGHPNYLNRFIDYPAIYGRIIAWAAYSHGFTGFLHYGYSFWQKTEQFYPFGIEKFSTFKGDCMLIYPSPEDNSYRISLRYLNMRDGAQDFELLKIAEKADKRLAAKLSASVAVGYNSFDEEEAHFEEVRKSLLELAEKGAKI